MQRLFAAFALATLAAQAHACPDLDALVKRYGITFSGFLVPIPAVAHPALSRDGKIVRLPVRYPDFVADGFRHTVVYDAGTRKAWILRTGGFVGVREWYGPVDADGAKLEHCTIKPEPEPDLVQHPPRKST
jgi:hypothetical protein